MSDVLVTRLCLVTSRDKNKIKLFPYTLPYRIEIKDIVFCTSDKTWCLWFIPPDDVSDDEIVEGELD